MTRADVGEGVDLVQVEKMKRQGHVVTLHLFLQRSRQPLDAGQLLAIAVQAVLGLELRVQAFADFLLLAWRQAEHRLAKLVGRLDQRCAKFKQAADQIILRRSRGGRRTGHRDGGDLMDRFLFALAAANQQHRDEHRNRVWGIHARDVEDKPKTGQPRFDNRKRC